MRFPRLSHFLAAATVAGLVLVLQPATRADASSFDLLQVSSPRELPSECTGGQVAWASGDARGLVCRQGYWLPAGVPVCHEVDQSLCTEGAFCWDERSVTARRCQEGRWMTPATPVDVDKLQSLGASDVLCGARPCAGTLPRRRYTVSATVGTYVTKSAGGRTLYRGPDPGLAIQRALDEAAVNGGTVRLRPGRYEYLTTVPTFIPNGRRWVKLDGRGATLVLSKNAPRALDARRTADFDTFRNLWIDDLRIDATFQPGDHHVIFGNRIHRSALYSQRVNFENIIVTNVRAFNVLTSYAAETDARTGIAIELLHPYGGESTGSFARNILIKNVRINGGNNGVIIVGTSNDGSRNPNITLDNILISDTTHQLEDSPAQGFPSSNFHIGSFARVGYVVIGNSVGRAAGDNGIEIDSAQFAILHDNIMTDQANVGYYVTNFHPALDSVNQRILLTGNDAIVTNEHRIPGYGRGYFVWGAGDAPPIGSVYFRDNSYRSESPHFGAFALGVYGRVEATSVEQFTIDYAATVFTGSNEEWQNIVIVENEHPSARLLMHDIELHYSLSVPESARNAGGSAYPYLFFIAGDRMSVDMEAIRVSVSATGLDRPSAGRVHVLYLGGASNLPSGRSRLSGRVAGLNVVSFVGDEDPIGIRLGSYLQVDPTLEFVDCDLSRLPDPSTAFVLDAGLENAAGVLCAGREALGWQCRLGSD